MKIKVNEVYKSLQGEGRYQGIPVIFIRLSGCTRNCEFCDSKYHTQYKEVDITELAKEINSYKTEVVITSGGEPTIQIVAIKELYKLLKHLKFHLETNGDLIKSENYIIKNLGIFSYICISPKDEATAKRVTELLKPFKGNLEYDIKIVTDLDKVNRNLVKYGTMLMPLTTYNKKKDKEIRQRVWNYCVSKNLFYSARLHVEVFGKKRGV